MAKYDKRARAGRQHRAPGSYIVDQICKDIMNAREDKADFTIAGEVEVRLLAQGLQYAK
jgi:hypothetical protein